VRFEPVVMPGAIPSSARKVGPLSICDALVVHKEGSVTELRLNRPELLNRFDEAVIRQLAVATTEVNKHWQAPTSEGLEVGFYPEPATSVSENRKEAVRAFQERADAVWRGR
jgi:hypothetical protein